MRTDWIVSSLRDSACICNLKMVGAGSTSIVHKKKDRFLLYNLRYKESGSESTGSGSFLGAGKFNLGLVRGFFGGLLL